MRRRKKESNKRRTNGLRPAARAATTNQIFFLPLREKKIGWLVDCLGCSASADSANQQSQTNSFNQIKNLMKVGWRWLASFTFIINWFHQLTLILFLPSATIIHFFLKKWKELLLFFSSSLFERQAINNESKIGMLSFSWFAFFLFLYLICWLWAPPLCRSTIPLQELATLFASAALPLLY